MSLPVRYPLIFNPKARSSKGKRARQFIMQHANRFALYATNHAQEAKELAQKFAEKGEAIVVAAGGDGTLNAVVSGLAGTQTALGVMPVGTMNVFARELGISVTSLDKALEIIDRGLVREIDLFSVNSSPFVQMAGFGFDAMVIEETKWESKRLLGPLAYILSAFKILNRKSPPLEITSSEGVSEKGIAVVCGNGALYGGQFRLFRHASNLDSKLDVIIFKKAGYRFLLDALGGVVIGGMENSKSVRTFQTESLVVKSKHDIPVEIDGELLGRFHHNEITQSHYKLRVIAP